MVVAGVDANYVIELTVFCRRRSHHNEEDHKYHRLDLTPADGRASRHGQWNTDAFVGPIPSVKALRIVKSVGCARCVRGARNSDASFSTSVWARRSASSESMSPELSVMNAW